MDQFGDLPQYQASPFPAPHSLKCAVVDVKQDLKCEHKCTVSRGDCRRLWVAVVLLCIATGIIGVHMIVNGTSGPAYNNNAVPGDAPQYAQAAAAAVDNTITSLASTSQSPPTTTTMWPSVLITSDAFSTANFPFPSPLSATTLPAHGNMHQQLLMAALSKRAMTPTPRVTGPSLTIDGSDETTVTYVVASTSPICIWPQCNLFNGHQFMPLPPSSTTYSASPCATTQHVGAAAAMKLPTIARDISAAENKYVRHGDCYTSSNALSCLRQGFDCVDAGDGAGPLCMGLQTDKQRDDTEKQRKADHSRRNKLIGGIVGGVIGLLLLLGGLWALWRHKSHKDQRRERAAGNGVIAHPVDPERAANHQAH